MPVYAFKRKQRKQHNPERRVRSMAVAVLALGPVLLERAMRTYIKRAVYKRLYGGSLTLLERLAVRLYKRLPDRHPIVLATLEGR